MIPYSLPSGGLRYAVSPNKRQKPLRQGPFPSGALCCARFTGGASALRLRGGSLGPKSGADCGRSLARAKSFPYAKHHTVSDAAPNAYARPVSFPRAKLFPHARIFAGRGLPAL